MLSTIGMNASRAQWSRYIVAATARIVSATLRTLMFDSTVDVCECDVSRRDPMRRIGSATLLFHLKRETRARLQRLVDGDARFGALGSGDDGELDVVGGVADNIHAGDARFAQVIGFDRSFARELAAEAPGKVGLLLLRRRDEQALAFHRFTAAEDQPCRAAVLMLEAKHAVRSNCDPVCRKLIALRAGQSSAVCAESDARRPRLHRQRQPDGTAAATDDRQRFVAVFPPVAIRTVMDARAVALPDARYLRQPIADARCEEQRMRPHALGFADGDFEMLSASLDAGNGRVAHVDSVRAKLLSAHFEQFERRGAVAGQIAVERSRGGVARRARVAEEHTPPATAQDERCAQPRRAAADDNDFVHSYPPSSGPRCLCSASARPVSTDSLRFGFLLVWMSPTSTSSYLRN